MLVNQPIVLLLCAAVISGLLAVSASKSTSRNGELQWLSYMFLAAGIWCLGYSLELAATTLTLKRMADMITYVGITTLPVMWFLFVAQYTGRDRWVTPLRYRLLLFVPAITLVLLASNDYHQLVYTAVELVTYSGASFLDLQYGPYWWLVHVPYSYGLMITGLALLIESFPRTEAIHRPKLALFVVATLLPLTINIAFVSGLWLNSLLDWTPISFIVTGFVFLRGAAAFDLFGVVPVGLDRLFNTLPDPVIIVNGAGRVVSRNQAAAEFFVAQDTIPETWIRNVLSKGGDAHSELDCNQRTFMVSKTPITDHAERLQGCLVVLTDITLRKDMEESLRRSEERYRTTIAMSKTGVWEYDIVSDRIWCSPEYFSMLGYDPSDYPEANQGIEGVWMTLLHPDDRDAAVGRFRQSIEQATNEMYESHFRMRRRDGSWAWILARGQILRDEHGTPGTLVVGTHIDMTEIRQQQEQIEYLSLHDHVTGLYNRRFFEEEVRRLDTQRMLPLTVMLLDVNGLKLVNDAFGHEMGDELLRVVAGVLTHCCRANDIIARVGGDEFAILFPKTDREQAASIRQRIIAGMGEARLDSAVVSVAMGYAVKETTEQTMTAIRKQAEDAMYQNKLKYGNTMRNRTVDTVLHTVVSKWDGERVHARSVSNYTETIARAMGLSDREVEQAALAGMLHDIGKVVIPTAILDKTEELTAAELDIVKRHPETGYQILRSVNEYAVIVEDVLHHHERWDGQGYPQGLTGEAIPLLARIIAVADAYEAMTAKRPYRTTIGKAEAIAELQRHAGTQFDPGIVQTFVDYLLRQKPNGGDESITRVG